MHGLGQCEVQDCFGAEIALSLHRRCGLVAQLVQCQTGTPLMQVQFPGAARDFPPRVNFQC